MPKVGIVMGSDSDMPVMSKAAEVLDELGVSYEMRIHSKIGLHVASFRGCFRSYSCRRRAVSAFRSSRWNLASITSWIGRMRKSRFPLRLILLLTRPFYLNCLCLSNLRFYISSTLFSPLKNIFKKIRCNY